MKICYTLTNISTFPINYKYKTSLSPFIYYVGTKVLSLKSHSISPSGEYIPKRRTVLHTILEKHFNDFVENYESEYAEECGRYSLERITAVVEEYLKCSDYKQGIARVKCTNPECNHDFFVPFSCKQFLVCPCCSQKRTLLFGEYLTDEVLLRLPHNFFTFTLPKSIRIFLKNDKYLFSDISKLIYTLIEDFYTEAAGRKILSGGCLVYQSFGDMMRFNSHWLVASYRLLLAQAAGAWDSIRGWV